MKVLSEVFPSRGRHQEFHRPALTPQGDKIVLRVGDRVQWYGREGRLEGEGVADRHADDGEMLPFDGGALVWERAGIIWTVSSAGVPEMLGTCCRAPRLRCLGGVAAAWISRDGGVVVRDVPSGGTIRFAPVREADGETPTRPLPFRSALADQGERFETMSFCLSGGHLFTVARSGYVWVRPFGDRSGKPFTFVKTRGLVVDMGRLGDRDLGVVYRDRIDVLSRHGDGLRADDLEILAFGQCRSVTFGGGRLAFCDGQGGAYVYERKGGVRHVPTDTKAFAVSLSSDGATLATGGRRKVTVWSLD